MNKILHNLISVSKAYLYIIKAITKIKIVFLLFRINYTFLKDISYSYAHNDMKMISF